MLVIPQVHSSEAKIWTDKGNYLPTEAVTIFGWGFEALSEVAITLEMPDETRDTVYAVTTDAGGFVCTYQLDGMEGTYAVTATDGNNTATTTFTEAKPTFSITIDTVNGYSPPFPPNLMNPIHLAGRASSTNFPGHLWQYQVQVDWGDGVVDTDSQINFVQYGNNFNGTWSSSPDHNYATGGTYTITVKLYHQQPPGGESGDASAQITISVAPPTVNVVVATSPSGRNIVVDSVTYAAPQGFNWVIGSTHSIGTTSPQLSGADTRYVWTNWSDGGAMIHDIVVPSTPTTYTAYFKTQHEVTVTASPAGAVGGTFDITYTQCGTTYTNVQKTTTWTDWVDASTTVTVSSPQDPINDGPGTRYKFDNYNPSASVFTTQPTTITLVYKAQYSVSFAQTGSAVAPTVTYTADTDPTDTVPFSVWVRADSQISYAYQAIVSGASGVRYVLTWTSPTSPQTVNGPMTILGTYKTQYYLTVVSAYDMPGGMGWYDAGTNAYATLAYGTENITAKVRAVFTSWTGDASGTGLTSNPILMNDPKTAVANWTIQYYLDVVIDPSNLPPIPGADWYNNCTWVKLTALTHLPDEAGVNGVRYKFSSWDVDGTSQGIGVNPIDIHMNAPHVATAHYTAQYYLTVRTDPLGVVTIPGEGWYDACNSVTLTAPALVPVSPGTRYRFDHWGVDTVTVPGNPITVHMDVPHVATAHYVMQCYLTVGTDPEGLVTVLGEGWYDKCTYVILEAPEYVYVSGDTRYRFDHWDLDTTTVPGNPITVHIDAPHIATAYYVKQYYLTVTDNVGGLSGVSTQSGWFDGYTFVTLTAPPFVLVSPGIRYTFDYWDVDTATVPGNPIDVHMEAPHTATAHYVKQYYLTVDTDPDGLNPVPIGEGWYDECTYLSLIAPPSSYLNSTEYVFVYWEVDGVSTSEDIIQVHMDMPHVAVAHYSLVCQHHLDAEPPRLIDLTKPVCTQWQELYPEYSRQYHLQSWHDTNLDGRLSPSDYIDLWDEDHQWKVRPYFWHVDDITVTMRVTKINTAETMYVEFEGGWAEYDRVIVLPECTQWHEVYPTYCRRYHLEKWFDNCDSKLSYCDRIILRDKDTGERAEYHVEEVKTDLIISPRATQIILCKMKDYVGKGYPQIICETIHNYYLGTTDFTVSAYYDGLQPIGNATIALNPLESGDAIIKWIETATWPIGIYNFTITVNTSVNGTLLYSTSMLFAFKITIVGDINGDGKVDLKDVFIGGKAFGSQLCQAGWNPNADINNDFKVDLRDYYVICKNFGNTDP
jgi:hypothetical protein